MRKLLLAVAALASLAVAVAGSAAYAMSCPWWVGFIAGPALGYGGYYTLELVSRVFAPTSN